MPDINELSERELEILKLVATGASNKEIGQQLFISPNTVKVHLKNIFSKIGAASRTEAAMMAVQLGLVPSGANAGSIPQNGGTQARETGVEKAQPRRKVYSLLGLAAILVLVGSLGILITTGRLSVFQVQASPSPSAEAPRWKEKASLPTARSGLAVASFEDKVYAIGGIAAQGMTGRVERFDPEANTWKELAPKPQPVADVQAAVIGGLIYVPGGRLSAGGQSQQLSNRLEVYDPYQDRWDQKAPLPVAISAYALTAFEGKLYLFGGWDGQHYLDTVFEYDPSYDAWQKRIAMPTPRAFASAAVAGGRIYVIGGYNGRQALATNEAYQPAREQGEEGDPWFTMKEMPAGRYGMGIASLADIIHVIGGEGEGKAALLPLKYFPQVDEWQTLDTETSEQLKSWSHLQLAAVGTNIYALGGQQDGKPTGQNMVYQAIYTIAIPFIK